MHIGICDDLIEDHALLKNYISHYMTTNQIDYTIKSFESGEALLASINTTAYDILFLDIYMEGKSGIETARQIRAKGIDCIIIFATTSRDHAIDGFEIGAIHYLLKPLNYETVTTALNRCSERLKKSDQYIIIQSNRTSIRILLKELIFAEVYGNALLVHTTEKELRTYQSLEAFLKLLPEETFLRCHRSYVLNMHYISVQEGADFILKDGRKIPIPKKDIKIMRQAYSDFLFRQVRRRNDEF